MKYEAWSAGTNHDMTGKGCEGGCHYYYFFVISLRHGSNLGNGNWDFILFYFLMHHVVYLVNGFGIE